MLDAMGGYMLQIASLLGAAGVIGGIVIRWVRSNLSGEFAAKGDISALGNRMEDLERRLGTMPTHQDIQSIGNRLSQVETRLGAVENGFAAISAQVTGVREGVARVERDLHLLLQHELGKKDAKP